MERVDIVCDNVLCFVLVVCSVGQTRTYASVCEECHIFWEKGASVYFCYEIYVLVSLINASFGVILCVAILNSRARCVPQSLSLYRLPEGKKGKKAEGTTNLVYIFATRNNMLGRT